MEQTRTPLSFVWGLITGEDADSTHDVRELYAEFVPEASAFGNHELEGLVTSFNRYNLTLCADGRVYDVVLRKATIYSRVSERACEGSFVRIHGTWSVDDFHATSITRVA